MAIDSNGAQRFMLNFLSEAKAQLPGAVSSALPKRPAAWAFEKLDTLRHRIIQRAGRFTRPQGELTRTMSANQAVRLDLLQVHYVLQKAA